MLKPFNNNLALLTGALRILYAWVLIGGLFALGFKIIDVFGYATIKDIGYIFFALHIFVLGHSVFKSGYIPKSLGILLILASFTYIVFFVDFHLSEILQGIIMLIMLVAELALSIWLFLKRDKIPEMKS